MKDFDLFIPIQSRKNQIIPVETSFLEKIEKGRFLADVMRSSYEINEHEVSKAASKKLLEIIKQF